MEFEIKNAEFRKKNRARGKDSFRQRKRGGSAAGGDRFSEAEALLYAAFAVLVVLIYLVVQRRPAIR